MSELKVIDLGDIRYAIENDKPVYYEYYAKSEADKVIADLEESHKMEVAQLLILNREQANAANRLRNSMEQSIRHQKYKRCLAMVDTLTWEHNYLVDFVSSDFPNVRFKRKHKIKWIKKWLEIAEKFKEVK